jgi:hypothetical protein
LQPNVGKHYQPTAFGLVIAPRGGILGTHTDSSSCKIRFSPILTVEPEQFLVAGFAPAW